MNRNIFLIALICSLSCNGTGQRSSASQPVALADESVVAKDTMHTSKNANVFVPPYQGYYQYGSNMGWINNNWRDEDVADVLVGCPAKNIEGVGATSLRPALYEGYVEQWGYDVRVSTFNYYTQTLGTENNTIFIGDNPTEAHREKRTYSVGKPSQSYETLYEPIWDNGENGTPVNDRNDYALYVYKIAMRYGKYVTFWEIKNEPDLTPNWQATQDDWWKTDPKPDDLINFNAPVQSYIRMLRVSYEVIKSICPETYICVGGIGYPSFLDAILRNTDNPNGGIITEKYPYKGGAWFDCLSYHIYPMYYLKKWGVIGWNFKRYSDAAVAAVVEYDAKYSSLLASYGYDGVKYPRKQVIITETNTPSKQVGDFIGSEESQRNYVMKVAVAAQRLGHRATYIYCPFDAKEHSDNGGEYDYKGLYKKAPSAPNLPLRFNEAGIAWRTMSRMLKHCRYDADETKRLNLPLQIDGGAFRADNGEYTYVLWAKTSKDLSEEALAPYTFPTSMDVKKMAVISWNASGSAINGNSLLLTGTPFIIKLNKTFEEALPPAPIMTKPPKIEAHLSDEQTTQMESLSFILPNPTWANIKVGDTKKFVVEFYPPNVKNKTLHWTSSDEKICTVDQNGVVTAVSVGNAKITLTPAIGGEEKAKSININVINP